MSKIFIKKRQPGFTLIELLVVIAIIGILASIVLVSLGGARKRAKDARIIADMSQIRSTAEIIYSSDGNYDRVDCANTNSEGIDKLCKDIKDQAGANPSIFKPASPADSYCAEVQLNSGKWYCVDSALRAKEYDSDPTTCSSNSFTCE